VCREISEKSKFKMKPHHAIYTDCVEIMLRYIDGGWDGWKRNFNRSVHDISEMFREFRLNRR